MNGKRKVSKKLAEKILTRLCLSPDESLSLLSLFEQITEEGTPAESLAQSLELQMDTYQMIAQWHHFAILSLMETADFKSNAEWIGRRLNLKVAEVRAALERMERLGLIRQDLRGRYRSTGTSYTTSDHVANIALRRAHGENLELARRCLEEHPLESRDFTSITMAIDPKKMAVAKKMIREFRDKLCRYLETGGQQEVYKFCMQLIPLTNLKEHS